MVVLDLGDGGDVEVLAFGYQEEAAGAVDAFCQAHAGSEFADHDLADGMGQLGDLGDLEE